MLGLQEISALKKGLAHNMACDARDQQFHGTVVLMVLHLRRLAKSNDVEVGLSMARELGMIDAEKEAFMRRCLDVDQAIQDGAEPPEPPTPDMTARLRSCILSINSADPA